MLAKISFLKKICNRKTFEEIKRILRVGMGPCQGNTCGQLLQREISKYLKIPLSVSCYGENGNSPGAGINDISGTTFSIGLTTITYHIEDASGNSAECTFDILCLAIKHKPLIKAVNLYAE